MKKQILLSALAMVITLMSQLDTFAQQNVGIGTTTPDASAMLDITATDKGILIPRLTTSQRTGVAAPATGLLVYDTDTKSFWYFNGTSWANLSAGGGAGWALTGNAGTNPLTNFMGTTDNQSLIFRVNNIRSGYLGTNGNIFWGLGSGANNATGNFNTANGNQTLFNNTTGSLNSAYGNLALYNNQEGYSNSADGGSALYKNTTGNLNTANGYVGLFNNISGENNTANGAYTLYSNTTGNGNTANGYQALYSNTTGDHNTAIGYHADVSSNSLTNATAIGAFSMVAHSNSIVLGSVKGINGASGATRVGIGTTSPNATLHVVGNTNLQGGLQINGNPGTAGQVLTSTGSGAPEWRMAAGANQVRFAVSLIKENVGIITSGNLEFISNGYNLDPTAIELGTDIITVNRSGLYHFNITFTGTMSPNISWKYKTLVELNLYYGLVNPFKLVRCLMNPESNEIFSSYFHLSKNLSIDVYIQAPANLRLAYYTNSSAESIFSFHGYLTGYLISE